MENIINFKKISEIFIYLTFFSLLISTAAANIAILIAITFGLISLFYNHEFTKYFLKNKISIIALSLFIILFISLFYSVANQDEALSLLKKYAKFLYIPILMYIFKDNLVRTRMIDFFIISGVLILFLSYLKYLDLFNPSQITSFLNIEYQDKLRDGVTIFQHSIIHGVLLSFFSFMVFKKGQITNNNFYYVLSFLGFFNVLFMNNSRTGYLIAISLILLIIIGFLQKNEIKKMLLAIALFSFSLFFAGKDVFTERLNLANNDLHSIQENKFSSSTGYRYVWLLHGLESFQDNLLLGTGVGSFKPTLKIYLDNNNLPHEEFLTQNPHNEFISISVQTGLIGLTIFLLLLLFLFIECKKNTTSLAIFFIIFISSCFNSLFYDNILGLFGIILICLSMADKRI